MRWTVEREAAMPRRAKMPATRRDPRLGHSALSRTTSVATRSEARLSGVRPSTSVRSIFAASLCQLTRAWTETMYALAVAALESR